MDFFLGVQLHFTINLRKNIIFCLEYFLLIFLVGYTAFKNVPGEEYQYEQLSELPRTMRGSADFLLLSTGP